MTKQTLILSLFAFSILGCSQNKDSIYPDFIGQNLEVIQKKSNWAILVKASGDLNKDGLDDSVIILESKDSIPEKRCENCKLLNSKPRIILVALNKDEN